MSEKELYEIIYEILFERRTGFPEHSQAVNESVDRIFEIIEKNHPVTGISETERKAFRDGAKTAVKVMLKIFTE